MTTTSDKQSASQAASPRQGAATAGPALRGPATVAQQLGNQHLQMLLRARLLQAKLTVSHPQDVYEQEADRVADRVMRMTDPAAPMVAPSATLVQRRCRDCDDELPLQRVEDSAANVPTVDAATERSIQSLSTRGSALPESVRSFMEPRFDTDLGAVRVHDDAHAHGLARAVNAQAFTVGRNVVFGAGHYAPETEGGKRLLAHELTHVVQQGAASPAAALPNTSSRLQRQPVPVQGAGSEPDVTEGMKDVAFVRFHQDEKFLRLYSAADEHSTPLADLAFGQRLHLLDDSNPRSGWRKVAVLGKSGYVDASRIHLPPAHLIQKDPALRLIRVRPGLTFYDLVHEAYGIRGDESTKDLNMNHFINAIRSVNKDEAFLIKAGVVDRAKNAVLSGRDAKNTQLKANFDLWIPSFSVATKMDVGSGTISGNIAHLVHQIEQKLADFKNAGLASGKYIAGAVTARVGPVAEGLLTGLIDFAILAAKIMTATTVGGALIGALFGGVGAAPGAEIGFELGLLALEYMGLAMLLQTILSVAGTMLAELGRFISLAWKADGDAKQLDLAGRSLADFLGTLASAALIAAAAYLLKKGANALKGTKFARTLGESRLAEWFRKRQQLTTTQGETPRLPSGKETRQLPAGDQTQHAHSTETPPAPTPQPAPTPAATPGRPVHQQTQQQLAGGHPKPPGAGGGARPPGEGTPAPTPRRIPQQQATQSEGVRIPPKPEGPRTSGSREHPRPPRSGPAPAPAGPAPHAPTHSGHRTDTAENPFADNEPTPVTGPPEGMHRPPVTSETAESPSGTIHDSTPARPDAGHATDADSPSVVVTDDIEGVVRDDSGVPAPAGEHPASSTSEEITARHGKPRRDPGARQAGARTTTPELTVDRIQGNTVWGKGGLDPHAPHVYHQKINAVVPPGGRSGGLARGPFPINELINHYEGVAGASGATKLVITLEKKVGSGSFAEIQAAARYRSGTARSSGNVITVAIPVGGQ